MSRLREIHYVAIGADSGQYYAVGNTYPAASRALLERFPSGKYVNTKKDIMPEPMLIKEIKGDLPQEKMA